MPSKINIPTGEHIARFIVLGKGTKQSHYLCLCICGKRLEVKSEYLRHGRTKSCGCCKGEFVARSKTKHGYATNKTKAYIAWVGMRDRCNRENVSNYHNYGGRGITVCKRWDSFANFLSDVGEPPHGDYSIDRIDNNKGYSPDNCRWATRKQQNSNRRNVYICSLDGFTDTAKGHCRRLNVNYGTITSRIGTGEDPVSAIKRPIRKMKQRIHARAAASGQS